jgi:L-xylulokinase
MIRVLVAGAVIAMAALGPARMDAKAMTARRGGLFVPAPSTVGVADRGSILRAVLENLAFALRANLQQLEEVSGAPILALTLSGGMIRAPIFPQIVADALGRPVSVAPTPETSALGAAMAAAVASGDFEGLDAAAAAMAGAPCRIEPSARRAALYEDRYQEWQKLERVLSRLSEV